MGFYKFVYFSIMNLYGLANIMEVYKLCMKYFSIEKFKLVNYCSWF
jgi:hypothetical protein